jgi:AraC-like DNA-binding protein
MVRWELEGKPPFVSEVLSHPSIHLVIEQEQAAITGVQEKGKFRRTLEGNGHVFSVKFRPGGFYPFFKKPVSQLNNSQIPAADFFGKDFPALQKKVMQADTAEKIQLLEDLLLGMKPEPYEAQAQVLRLTEMIMTDRDITRVEQVADAGAMSVRKLQRLFSQYVGPSPKWVIRRYRLHEALETLKAGEVDSLAALAHNLGYADQAHFIRDFKSLVGKTPAEYLKFKI